MMLHSLHSQYVSDSYQKFYQHLTVCGIALMAVSVLYFLASNWFFMDKFARLAIPQIILLFTAMASVYLPISETIRQVLHTISGLMLGLSLAVIGQIYQTGADSFWLFTIWSLLLIGWLYQQNIGIFSLLCITSQLALALFFKQSHFHDDIWLYLLLVNGLAGVQFWVASRYYPALKYVFIAGFSWLSLYSVFEIDETREIAEILVYLLSIFALPMWAIYRFYQQKQQIATSLMACGLGTSLFIWLAMQLNFFGVESFFVIGILVLAWFAVIAKILLKIFPVGRFHRVPLVLGAWFAGINFSAMFLIFWDNVSLGMGVLLFMGSLAVLHRVKHDFVRQLAYSLLICGQIAVLGHLALKSHEMLPVAIIQILFACAVMTIRPHWFLLLLQILGVYLAWLLYLMSVSSLDENVWSVVALDMLFLTSMLALLLPIGGQYRRAVWLLLLSVLTASLITRTFWQDEQVWQLADLPISYRVGFLSWLVVVVGVCYWQKILKISLSTVSMLGLAVLLTVLGYYELFMLLLGLAFALHYQDKLIYGIYVLAIVLFLWQLYYRLDLSFLLKSLTILGSGVAFLAVAYALKRLEKMA